MVISLVTIKYIYHQLGEDMFGIIAFAATLNAVLSSVFEMGISITTIREVSSYFKSDPDYVCALIRTTSLIYWAIYVFIGIIIYFLIPIFVEKWINLKTMDVFTATYILRILGIASFVSLPKSIYYSLLSGLQRMDLTNIVDLTTNVLQQLGTIFILILGGTLFFVVYWYALCYCINIISYVTVSSRFFPLKSLAPGYSSSVIKRNVNFASYMMFMTITHMVYSYIDKIIVSKFLPIGKLGYYNLVYSLVGKAQIVTGAVSQSVFPSFSSLSKLGDHAKMMSQYRKSHDLLCFGTVPLFAAIVFGSLPLYSYILKEDTARLLFMPTILLCVGLYVKGTLTVPGILSQSMGMPEILARQYFYGLFIVLPATVVLVYYFGLVGASISVLIFWIFGFFYAVPKICSRCLKISKWEWYVKIFKIFALTSLTYGTGWFIVGTLSYHSILYLALTYIGASTVYVFGAFFIVSNDLREYLLRTISNVKGVQINNGV